MRELNLVTVNDSVQSPAKRGRPPKKQVVVEPLAVEVKPVVTNVTTAENQRITSSKCVFRNAEFYPIRGKRS